MRANAQVSGPPELAATASAAALTSPPCAATPASSRMTRAATAGSIRRPARLVRADAASTATTRAAHCRSAFAASAAATAVYAPGSPSNPRSCLSATSSASSRSMAARAAEPRAGRTGRGAGIGNRCSCQACRDALAVTQAPPADTAARHAPAIGSPVTMACAARPPRIAVGTARKATPHRARRWRRRSRKPGSRIRAKLTRAPAARSTARCSVAVARTGLRAIIRSCLSAGRLTTEWSVERPPRPTPRPPAATLRVARAGKPRGRRESRTGASTRAGTPPQRR